ncbi:MAG: DNA repair protein RadC [Burkholderiaceae bacterium]|nr:DNA repair protein RadC [Burkholderiaceae bacterium]
MPITDWPENERPREKLIVRGPDALSDAELLAILLRVGIAGKSAVDLARELLNEFGGIHALLSASPKEVAKIKGLGQAKALQFQAALHLGKRALAEQLKIKPALGSSLLVQNYVRLLFSGETSEVFMAVFMDAQNQLIASVPLFRGTLTQTSVYPREVVKAALNYNAAALILAHNHPSGIPTPSAADITLTKMLKAALALIDVRVHDHFIVVADQAVSMAEQGLM